MLTSNPGVIVPITFNGSSAAMLTCGLNGRMTGGGSVFETDGARVTHGFELYSDTEDVPNRLEINWSGHRFHLETLVSAFCSKDPTVKAGHPTNIFNTYVGVDTGRLDDVAGATARWTFADAGEPGKTWPHRDHRLVREGGTHGQREVGQREPAGSRRQQIKPPFTRRA
jgi:hypothetical protein